MYFSVSKPPAGISEKVLLTCSAVDCTSTADAVENASSSLEASSVQVTV